MTLGDWIADPSGLYLADFDLLTRMPGLEAVDVVATAGAAGIRFSSAHSRLAAGHRGGRSRRSGSRRRSPTARPVLTVPGADAGSTGVRPPRSRGGADCGRASAQSERRWPRVARPRRRRLQAAAAVPVPGSRSLRQRRHAVSDLRRAAARGGAVRRGARSRVRVRRIGLYRGDRWSRCCGRRISCFATTIGGSTATRSARSTAR